MKSANTTTKNCFLIKKNLKNKLRSSLVQVIRDLGNPFIDDSDELVSLDTRVVLDESVVKTVRTVTTLGKEQFITYHKEVFVNCTRSIHDPIKKNSLLLFSRPQPCTKGKQAEMASLNRIFLFFSPVRIL